MSRGRPGAAAIRPFEPVLATPRLRLRPYRLGDRDGMVAMLGDFEVSRRLALVPHPYAPEDADRFLAAKLAPDAEDDHFGLAIECDGQFCGGISLRSLSRMPMLGYWLGRSWWGRGLMTEAVGAMLDHAFGPLGCERIGSGVFEGNEASLAIQRRFGFEILGTSEVFSVALGRTTLHIDTLLTLRRHRETKR